VAVSCDARDAEWGTVMRLRADAPDRPVVSFASVSALFATVAADYDTDVYYVDDNGRLELDGQGLRRPCTEPRRGHRLPAPRERVSRVIRSRCD
jgi:hypothetical protein